MPFTHPDKLLFPADGVTKEKLADYYLGVWPRMKQLLDDRPITFHRFPEGLGAPGFYQRRAQEYFPTWVRTSALPMKQEPGAVVREVVVDHPATLVFLVNIGALEIHASLARANAPDMADLMIFDLDPPEDYTDEVRRAALAFRDMLDGLGLAAFVKTTGSRGFHVTVPLKPVFSFDHTRSLARALGQRVIAANPDLLTLENRKDKRQGRILVDIWRNAYAQTAVAPWSVRARPGAPVAIPLEWNEMTRDIHPRRWTMKNIARRLSQRDPWAGLFDAAVDLRDWMKSAPDDLRQALADTRK